MPFQTTTDLLPPAAILLLLVCLPAGLLLHRPTRVRRPAALLRLGLALIIGGSALAIRPAPTEAAATFPRYAYIVTSGPSTYDLMLTEAGKDKRLGTTAVPGTGISDAVARIAPDGQRVAYRVTGDKNNGSSLRLFDIKARTAMTITFSKSPNLGIGAFAWAPDGKSLAFTWTTPAMSNPDDGYGSVWVVDANGKNQRKVLSAQLNDRLVAWAPDSSGFYFERQEDVPDGGDPIAHLMYLPLGGQPRSVLRSIAPTKKSPGLQFDTFRVWAAPVVSGTTPPPVRIVALATGDLSLLGSTVPPPAAPAAPAAPPAVPPSPGVVADPVTPVPAPPLTTAKVKTGTTTTEKPALVVGRDDGAALVPLNADTARPDVLTWSQDGTHLFASGGKVAAAWWFDLASGKRVALSASLVRSQPIAWSADSRYAVFANAGLTPATTIITADLQRNVLTASRKVGTPAETGSESKNLAIPYINQVWDTANSVNGNWACGPTSVAMVLSYYGRLDPWPLEAKSVKAYTKSRAASPPAHPGRDFAQYITAPFTYKGRDFTHTTKDPAGHKVAGLYGSIVFPDGLAHWEAMQDVLKLYDLKPELISASWSGITAALDKGYPVILGTSLTADGHIIVARGYTAGGYLLVNDPYGNKFGKNGYGQNDGENVSYPWKNATVKLAMSVKGTIWTPTPTPASTATVTPAPPTPTR
jgi:Tol biopolymer transport system component